MSPVDPPAPARVVEAGAPRGAAQRAGVLIHGRERTPEEMIDLAVNLQLERVRWLAPTVEGGSWYPGRFFDPIAANAPHISRAFEIFDQMIDDASEGGRLPPGQIIVMGFSQGACLALEYTVRNLGRSRNIVAFTGGLFGSPGALWPAYPRPLSRTRVLLTGSDTDDWVPEEHVRESARVLAGLGAEVTLRIYPGRPHVICEEEIEEARRFLQPIP
jgi:phospholipase/carboxylesterase